MTPQRGNLWKGSIRSLGLASDETIEANIEDTDDIKDCVPAGHGFTIRREFSDLQRSMLKMNEPKVAGLPVRGASFPPRRAYLL